MTEHISQIKRETREIQKEFQQKTVGYITTAMGLVAGLAWNEAIKALIETYFPLDKSGVILKFTYAILVTVMIVIVSFVLLKISKKSE